MIFFIFRFRNVNRKKLKEIMPFANGRVNYSDINSESYVTTDNLLQNCEGMKMYESVPNIDKVVEYKVGDVLVSNIRPYLKKIWFAGIDGGCSPDVLVFRNANQKEYNSKYLYCSLRRDSFFDFMMEGKKGMKMPRGDKDTIPNFEIVVPSLAEQERVVALVEAEEMKINDAKSVMASVKERKQAVLDKYLK